MLLVEGYEESNYPLLLGTLIKFSLNTLFFENVYFAAAEDAGDVESAMPLQLRI